MSVQKCTSLIMALFLLASNMGLAFNVHYCKGQIAAVLSVYNLDEPCVSPTETFEKGCCAAAHEDHKACCSDEVIQADYDDIIVQPFSFDFAWSAVLFIAPVTMTGFLEETTPRFMSAYYCEANSPPLYRLYSQYIYYA